MVCGYGCVVLPGPATVPPVPVGQPAPSLLSAAPPASPSSAVPETHCAHHPTRPPPARGKGEGGRITEGIVKPLRHQANYMRQITHFLF